MSGNRVTVTDGHLEIEPLGLDKLWSFTRRLRIPLTRVTGARFDPGLKDQPKGWRGPGLHVPGKLAGTFHRDGKRQFWNISGYDGVLVIELDPAGRFNRLHVTVDNPAELADAINNARRAGA